MAPIENRTVQVELRYSPRVIRVSELGQAGGHSNPSAFLDNRNEWNRLYYFRGGSNQPIQNTDKPRLARLWYVYERGATGPGQVKRPYMKTQRLQVRLNHAVALDTTSGQPIISVSGAGSFYQVDPGNGRVYFELPDEGRQVTITYTWIDGNGRQVGDQVQGFVLWQTEMAEQPVPIEQPLAEGSVYAFPDPFDPDPVSQELRPGPVWVFFTSTRGGTPDAYYLALSPRFGPRRLP